MEEKEEEVSVYLHQKLVDSGKREILKKSIEDQLEANGWMDKVRRMCLDMALKRGKENISVELFSNELMGTALDAIPVAQKFELLRSLEKILLEDNND